MIGRYEDKLIGPAVNDLAKHRAWLHVDITVLRVREGLGQIPVGMADKIEGICRIDEKMLKLIKRRDEAIKHDLQAHVDTAWLQLILHQEGCDFWGTIEMWEADSRKDGGTPDEIEARFQDFFTTALKTPCPEAECLHRDMTSYDTEEPAMAMLLIFACGVINQRMNDLIAALLLRGWANKGNILMGETHGQPAQPITFLVRVLNWAEGVLVARMFFRQAWDAIKVMKLSGTVGMHFPLAPEVEDAVGKALALAPVISTQVVGLGRKARLVNALAEIAVALAKINEDLWLMAKWQVGEIREPFGKNQTGSSAMPHKKNPITIEQGYGMARLVAGYAGAVMANVNTHLERDISQSSVERVAIFDAFHTVGHMLRRLTWVIQEMQVDPDRMRENFDRTYGTWASQEVATLLRKSGVAAKQAEEISRTTSAAALHTRTHLLEHLKTNEVVLRAINGDVTKIEEIFRIERWIAHEPAIHQRFLARWGNQLIPT